MKDLPQTKAQHINKIFPEFTLLPKCVILLERIIFTAQIKNSDKRNLHNFEYTAGKRTGGFL